MMDESGWRGGKDEDRHTKLRTSTVTLLRLHPNHQPQLRTLKESTSVATDFRGVTGGVYKTR